MTRTNSSAERPADLLARLGDLRMRGQTPSGGVYVTTERDWSELWRGKRFAVVEVWRRDLGQLNWRPLAGLKVYAFVSWTSYDERLALFEELHAAEPSELNWSAINPRGTGPSSHWMGCVWEKAGVPMDWHTPFDQMLQEALEEGPPEIYGEPPFKAGEQLVSYGRV